MTAADIFLATEYIGKYWEHGSYSTELGRMKDVCPDDSSLTVTNCFLRNAKVPTDAETGGEYCKCWIETDRVGRITALAHDAPNKPELRTDDTNPVTTPNTMAEPEVIGGPVGSSTPQVDETPLETLTPPQPTSEEKAGPEPLPKPTPAQEMRAADPPTTPTAAAEQGNILESSPTQPPAAPEPEPFSGTLIPSELKNVNQWLCWKYDERDGKKTKIPIDPETYKNTSAPEAAWSYEVSRKALTAGYRGDVGLGFSLKNGFAGIDLDHVLDEAGQLKPEYAYLESVIVKIASYTEQSPSRTGLHILFRCDDIPAECKAGRKRKGNIIEMYCEGRFFTVTGLAWKYPNELSTLSAEEYRDVHSMLFGDSVEPPTTSTKEASLNATLCSQAKPTRSDNEVYFQVTRNPKYKALWDGDITGYPSASEADFALMCQLAEATDHNKEQMIRMFRQSELSDRQKAVDRPEYLDTTANNAIKAIQQTQTQQQQRTVTREISRGYNGQEEEANRVCREMAGNLPNIKYAGKGIYVIIDPNDGIAKLVSSGDDDVFQRWCYHVFPDRGYDAKFSAEVYRNIAILHAADPIQEIDIKKPITAIPCMSGGYISLKDGRKCEPPAEMEYCPFFLHLTADEAAYDQNYTPNGRALGDLMTYLGHATVSYLMSVAASSIPRIPANRKVVVLTGPSRSSKTTFGMLLGELGLAPAWNVDFSAEIDRTAKFRPELATHISQYPMIFINDPTDPDGNAVKKLCDVSQQYERKYKDQISVYQRSTCVLTMNHPPEFKTSAMENKIFFVCSHQSYAGCEIPPDEYLSAIRSDGSIQDIWQEILHTGLKNKWEIKIPEECKDHNNRLQTDASPLQKWLSLCKKPPADKEKEHFEKMHEIYLNYMVYANPDVSRDEIEFTLTTRVNAAAWYPTPKKDGIEGKSKNDIRKQLDAMGFTAARKENKRGYYILLPESSENEIYRQNDKYGPPKLISSGEARALLHPTTQKIVG